MGMGFWLLKGSSCWLLEGVRSVGAHGELELEKDFVRRTALAIFGAAELGPDDAEFAGHVGDLETAAGVLEERQPAREIHQRREGVTRIGGGVGGQTLAPLRTVEAAADDPAAVDLVVAGDIEAEGFDKRT